MLVLEQGESFATQNFARSNWNLRKWLWMPRLGCRGIFRMSFFRHVTVLSGAGVGGGSLVYANTLPTPPPAFFQAAAWRGLADWENELAPHYQTALRMLGANTVPFTTPADDALREVARDLGREQHVHPSRVAVWFGEEGVEVDDPYFDGAGPRRSGCTACGACMVGCRVGAKNTLDRNYLHLAQGLGARVQAATEVRALRQSNPGDPIRVEGLQRLGLGRRRRQQWTADRVVVSGGVLGTQKLLQRMQADRDGLPHLSARLGHGVMTNSESLTGVSTQAGGPDHSKGIAIGSVLQCDERSHLETVRYPAGSGFFRLLMAPHAEGRNWFMRSGRVLGQLLRRPLRWLRAYLVRDWAKQTVILLYMRSDEETLRLVRGRFGRLRTVVPRGGGPTAHMPEAADLSRRVAAKLGGVVGCLLPETLFSRPTTAHILGGCPMGASAAEGVLDAHHRVHGHPDILVVDGSALSANPGVNPALTITAMAERAMSQVPDSAA